MPIDEDELARIRKLIEDLTRSMQRQGRGDPVVDIPPVIAISADQVRKIVRDEMKTLIHEAEGRWRLIMREEAKKVFHDEIETTFELIGLPIDDDNRKQTREDIEAAIRSAKTIQKLSSHGLLTIVGTIAGSIAAFFLAAWKFGSMKGGPH